METRGGRVHHAYGRCAPYIRNSRTIHAVPMHHHPRFCCSLGAAYALCSIFTNKIWIYQTFALREQPLCPYTTLVHRMIKVLAYQDIDILFPQPCSIKQQSENLTRPRPHLMLLVLQNQKA